MNSASTYQPTPCPYAEGSAFQAIGLVVGAILVRLAPPCGAQRNGSILLAASVGDGPKPSAGSATSAGHENPDHDDGPVGQAKGLRILWRAFVDEFRRSVREGLILYFKLLFHPIRSFYDTRDNARAAWRGVRRAVASLRETLARRRSHD